MSHPPHPPGTATPNIPKRGQTLTTNNKQLPPVSFHFLPFRPKCSPTPDAYLNQTFSSRQVDYIKPFKLTWAEMAQSVYRPATGWMVRESNPGVSATFHIRPDRPWDPPNLLYNGYRVISGGKAAGEWR
jgi:hypothetical protein